MGTAGGCEDFQSTNAGEYQEAQQPVDTYCTQSAATEGILSTKYSIRKGDKRKNNEDNQKKDSWTEQSHKDNDRKGRLDGSCKNGPKYKLCDDEYNNGNGKDDREGRIFIGGVNKKGRKIENYLDLKDEKKDNTKNKRSKLEQYE
eukprot:GHVP01054309.1.p2 GENE.GHVP01054309.1~~GHVP01054309.1.p2  ORF type:complete len:145 (-),score=31.30 GHVP01054309.1:394-828(-)